MTLPENPPTASNPPLLLHTRFGRIKKNGKINLKRNGVIFYPSSSHLHPRRIPGRGG